MFWFVKTVHLYSAGSESKIGLSYVNVVCVYGGRGGGVGLEVLKCFSEGVRIMSTCCVSVCVGEVRFSTSPSVKKLTDRHLLINDWSL